MMLSAPGRPPPAPSSAPQGAAACSSPEREWVIYPDIPLTITRQDGTSAKMYSSHRPGKSGGGRLASRGEEVHRVHQQLLL